MADDFTAFALKIGAFGTLVEVEAVSFKKKIAFQILEGVVNMTPVDTGRARGNWQVELGDTPGSNIKGTDIGTSSREAGGLTIQRGLSRISQVRLGESIWIYNNLSYVPILERGSPHGSDQAPHGMLQVTLNNVENQFR